MRQQKHRGTNGNGASAGANGGGRRRKLRIALYSHDTMGIGHMRRNQLIAEAFAATSAKPNILLICGAREACCFDFPGGVDCVTLPALAKRTADGTYHPRRLDVQLHELIRLRAAILRAALDAFEPDVLIVDKVPRGVLGELDDAIASLKSSGGTRLVLGLRDVLDDPRIVADEWAHGDYERVVRDCYDAVWVYGSRDVYDVARRYCFSSDVADKIRYSGYLRRYDDAAPGASRAANYAATSLDLPAGEIILCVVGGGQDGGHVAEAFAAAAYPAGATGVIVAGPFMPPEAARRLREQAQRRLDLRVLEFVPNIDALLRRATRVVAMGGYNTVCELLSLGKPALVVPRTAPRREQLIRAQHLHDLGLLDYLVPERLTPDALSEWLNSADVLPAPRAAVRIDFDGLKRLPQMLSDVCAAPPVSVSIRTRTGAVHVA